MPSLSDQLKALGVHLGSEKPIPRPHKKIPIEDLIDGEIIENSHGAYFEVSRFFPHQHPYGHFHLEINSPMEKMAAWAKDERISNLAQEAYAFIDTETTGLAGGSGTYAFLIGAGRFTKQGFQLKQFFMREPSDELAMLAGLEDFLSPCTAIVSFNGKSFDLPLIRTRYITNKWPSPFDEHAHIDLLHLARRLWRESLPSRTLGYLEEHILGQSRSTEDTPGWMIPEMYFEYLKTGDPSEMKGIFYHNELDILSMVTLLNHSASMVQDPIGAAVSDPQVLIALGRLYQDMGYLSDASKLFSHLLAHDLAEEEKLRTIKLYSYLQRRLGNLPEAMSLWWQAAAAREIYAHEELAKYYEHQARDYQEARKWTLAALAILKTEANRFEQIQWEEVLKYRLARLERKLKRDMD